MSTNLLSASDSQGFLHAFLPDNPQIIQLNENFPGSSQLSMENGDFFSKVTIISVCEIFTSSSTASQERKLKKVRIENHNIESGEEKQRKIYRKNIFRLFQCHNILSYGDRILSNVVYPSKK